MCRQGGLKQSAITQWTDQGGKELWVRCFPRERDQAMNGISGSAEIDFELGVRLVCDGEIGIQIESLPKGRFCLLQPVPGFGGKELCRHVINSSKPCPRRRITRIGL